jgi:hypothetical protein
MRVGKAEGRMGLPTVMILLVGLFCYEPAFAGAQWQKNSPTMEACRVQAWGRISVPPAMTNEDRHALTAAWWRTYRECLKRQSTAGVLQPTPPGP